jgi:hypothetical protein
VNASKFVNILLTSYIHIRSYVNYLVVNILTDEFRLCFECLILYIEVLIFHFKGLIYTFKIDLIIMKTLKSYDEYNVNEGWRQNLAIGATALALGLSTPSCTKPSEDKYDYADLKTPGDTTKHIQPIKKDTFKLKIDTIYIDKESSDAYTLNMILSNPTNASHNIDDFQLQTDNTKVMAMLSNVEFNVFNIKLSSDSILMKPLDKVTLKYNIIKKTNLTNIYFTFNLNIISGNEIIQTIDKISLKIN